MSFSFLKGRTLGVPTKNVTKKGDPLTLAKTKVIEGIQQQKKYATLVAGDQPLPTGKGGRTT